MKRVEPARALILAGALTVAAASACGRKPQSGDMSPVAAERDSVPKFVDVQVDNHNWSDVVVYLLHGGIRTRLGTVGTAQSISFRFPASYAVVDRVSLLVAPIGSSQRFESERFSVLSGQRVFWTIENTLNRSSLLVR
jgi:hypothetical protein